MYAELLDRYTKEGDTVLEFFGGAFTGGLAHYKFRKWVGVEEDPKCFRFAVERLTQRVVTAEAESSTMGEDWANVVPITWPKYACPSWATKELRTMEDLAGTKREEINAAVEDGKRFQTTVNKSSIPNSGLGLFALTALSKGTCVGYLWGWNRFFWGKNFPEPHSGRIIKTHKMQKPSASHDGKKPRLYIDVSRRCAAGYINDATKSKRVRPPLWSHLCIETKLLFRRGGHGSTSSF